MTPRYACRDCSIMLLFTYCCLQQGLLWMLAYCLGCPILSVMYAGIARCQQDVGRGFIDKALVRHFCLSNVHA